MHIDNYYTSDGVIQIRRDEDIEDQYFYRSTTYWFEDGTEFLEHGTSGEWQPIERVSGARRLAEMASSLEQFEFAIHRLINRPNPWS